MSHGLSIQAAYTWSKSLNDFTNAAINSANSGDPNNFKQQYGPIRTIIRNGWPSITAGTCPLATLKD